MTPAQKTIFHVCGTTFHLALGSRAPRSVAFDAKTIMSSEIAKEWMDLTRMESDLLHVVIENGLRNPAKELESALVSANEQLLTHGESELDVAHPAIGKDHHKCIDIEAGGGGLVGTGPL